MPLYYIIISLFNISDFRLTNIPAAYDVSTNTWTNNNNFKKNLIHEAVFLLISKLVNNVPFVKLGHNPTSITFSDRIKKPLVIKKIEG